MLAHERPFDVGVLRVEPATRQVIGEGVRQTLEPRVMQVLVALARAGDEVLTRDDLIRLCWNGRIVGEDAINRVLSRLRRLAAGIGQQSFAIETISRVGYRLVAGDTPEAGQRVDPVAVRQTRLDRRLVLGGAFGLASLSLGGAILFNRGQQGRDEPLPEAKALYDRAVLIRGEGGAQNRQALAYLREAVRLSPTYGEAWGELALAYRSAINNEDPERVEGFEERLAEAARNAERYDPGNADAVTAMLPSKSFYGRWLEHDRIYRSAIERTPGHSAGYSLLGTLLMDVGRWTEAVEMLLLARAREQSSPVLRYKLIIALWASGRISAAEQEVEQAMRLWPQHGAIWQTKIKLLSLTGRPREALALASDPAARPLSEGDAPDQSGRLLYLSALASRAPADADRAIEQILREARRIEQERVNAAMRVLTLGRPGITLDMLEGVYLRSGAWAVRNVSPSGLATHPLFQPHARPLWKELRFSRILDSTGLEQYWRSTNSVPDYRRSM